MKMQVGEFCGMEFTTALLNLYRDGSECLGYHSDKVSAGGGGSLIASISLGASRDFAIKPLAGVCDAVVTKPVNIPLHNGSLLIMSGSMQDTTLKELIHWLCPKLFQQKENPFGTRVKYHISKVKFLYLPKYLMSCISKFERLQYSLFPRVLTNGFLCGHCVASSPISILAEWATNALGG